jgi:hypothetical protein
MDEAWGKAKARGLFKVDIDEKKDVSLQCRGFPTVPGAACR